MRALIMGHRPCWPVFLCSSGRADGRAVRQRHRHRRPRATAGQARSSPRAGRRRRRVIGTIGVVLCAVRRAGGRRVGRVERVQRVPPVGDDDRPTGRPARTVLPQHGAPAAHPAGLARTPTGVLILGSARRQLGRSRRRLFLKGRSTRLGARHAVLRHARRSSVGSVSDRRDPVGQRRRHVHRREHRLGVLELDRLGRIAPPRPAPGRARRREAAVYGAAAASSRPRRRSRRRPRPPVPPSGRSARRTGP